MGLLDGLNFEDPNTIGLLSAAANMFERSGPSLRPTSFGQVLGSGLLGGLQAYGATKKQKLDQEKEQMQMDMLKQQIAQAATKSARDQRLQDFIVGRLGGSGAIPQDQMDASIKALGQGAEAGSIGPTVSNAARMDGILPPSQRRSSGGFPFTLNDVTMLHAMGGPNLVDAYKLATDPVKLEGGSTYVDRATGQERYMPKIGEGMQIGPNGVSVSPGYLGSLSAIKGAETDAVESAKAKQDLLPIGYVGPDGRPIGGTRAGYINSLGGTTGAPTRPAQLTAPEGFPRVSPQQQAEADRTALLYAKQDIDSATTPEERAQAQRVYDKMLTRFNNGQSVITGSGYAPTSQRPGAPVLQSEAEKQQQLGTITGRQQTQQELNKNWITASYNPILEAGRAAGTMTASLDALQNIDLKTGWNTEAKANAANILTGLGIGSENAKLFATNAQKFQSVAMDRLLTTLQAQKGPQTEGDSTRAQQTFAQLKNTPEANQFISDFARAKANMDQRRAQFYQEALPLAQQTGDLNEIDRRWAKIQGSIWSDPVLQRYARGK